jgi:hypothetical protein
MNRRTLIALSLMVLSGVSSAALSDAALAAVPDPARAATQAGLVSVNSRALDEVYLRPSQDWAGYRKVLIDPAEVVFKKNWLKDLNSTRGPSRWLSPSDAAEVAQVAGASMAKMVADQFVAKGYAIVTAPGAGVLRATPSVTELDVYEPDGTFSRPERLFTKDAGTATLGLELRDSQSGALLGLVSDRGTATQIRRLNNTTQTSNAFWFDAMFRLWAANCIAAIQAGPAR